MRLAQVLVSDEQLPAIRRILDEESIDHVVLADDRPGEDASLVVFPLPSGAVGEVLSRLRDAGLAEEEFEVLTDATMASTERLEENIHRYERVSTYSGLSRDELHGKVREMTGNPLTYYAGTLLSAVVAAAGLLLDSVALVIGAMVIAPQVSTALSVSVGVLAAEWRTFRQGINAQVLGLAGAVAVAAAFAWAVRALAVVSPSAHVAQLELVSQRLSPGVLTTVAGLAAGAAGAFGFATDRSTSLVGVMIAAALIPAAAAAGIGVAWGLPALAAGSSLLLAVNLAAVNATAYATLWVIGYRTPDTSFGDLLAGHRAVGVALVVAILLSVAGAGALTYQQVSFQGEVDEQVTRTLDRPAYEAVGLVSTTSAYAAAGSDRPEVTVRVTRPADSRYPRLADRIEANLERGTGRDVAVTVRYVEQSSAA